MTPFGIHFALIGANLQSLFSLPISFSLYFDFSIAMCNATAATRARIPTALSPDAFELRSS
jgi:hypothetical protein